MIMAQIIRLADKVRVKQPIAPHQDAEILPFTPKGPVQPVHSARFAPKRPAEPVLSALPDLAFYFLLIASTILIIQGLIERIAT